MSGYNAGTSSDLGTCQSSRPSSVPGMIPRKGAYSSYTLLGYGELPGSEGDVSRPSNICKHDYTHKCQCPDRTTELSETWGSANPQAEGLRHETHRSRRRCADTEMHQGLRETWSVSDRRDRAAYVQMSMSGYTAGALTGCGVRQLSSTTVSSTSTSAAGGG